MTWSAEAEADAEVAGKRSHDGGGNAMHAHLTLLVMEEQLVLLLGKFLRAAAGANDDSKAAEFVEREAGRMNAGSSKGFACSRDRERQDARHVSAVFFVHPGEFVEAGNLARDLNVEFAGIETRDAPHAAAAFEDGLRESRAADAVRADHPHAGDDDTSFVVHE